MSRSFGDDEATASTHYGPDQSIYKRCCTTELYKAFKIAGSAWQPAEDPSSTAAGAAWQSAGCAGRTLTEINGGISRAQGDFNAKLWIYTGGTRHKLGDKKKVSII